MAPRNRRVYGLRNGRHSQQNEQQLEAEPVIAQTTSNQDDTSDSEISKNTRGPTYLPEIWALSKTQRISVEFNKKGQPIGPNKKKLTGFLGTLARNGKYTPIDVDDWRKVPNARKAEILGLIKERFVVPPGSEHWMLKSIGKKRRSWKSRVKVESYDPNLPIENQVYSRPARVVEEQWKNVVPHWNSDEAKSISEDNKKHRQSKIMHQTTGKLSFAEIYEELKQQLGRSPSRVEMFDACYTNSNGSPSNDAVGVALAGMKDYQSQLPPGSLDLVSLDDSFAKVMGKDPPGHVRMFGLGVNQSDVWGEISSRTTCHRMVLEHRAAMERMEEKIDEQSQKIAELQANILPQQRQNVNSPLDSMAPSSSPRQSSNSLNVIQPLKVGGSVLLKSMFDLTKTVAKGYLRSIDSTKNVGGTQLGANWYEVQVMVPMEWDEELIRPYSNLTTLGDALGTCIAWPRHLVTYAEE